MPASEVATPSPRGLSRLRRTQDTANRSTNSLASSSNSDDPAANAGLGATDGGGGGANVWDRMRRRSIDDRSGSLDGGSKRLSNLLPGRRNKLQRKKSNNELERPLSMESGNGLPGNHSDLSLGQDESGHSSLLTDDNSDVEGKPVRPTLSPHQSHIGYLTLSSPEINSQTKSVATESDIPQLTDAPALEHTTSIPQIIEPSHTEPLPAPVLRHRDSSPVGRLKEVFASQRKKDVGDAESVKSASGVSAGFGGVLRPSSRRGSLSRPGTAEPTKQEASSILDTNQNREQPESSDGQTGQVREPATTTERPHTPKQQRGRPRINTGGLPQTPPNQNDTPTTFVTPPTPTDPNADHSTFPNRKPPKKANTLSSVESIKHRRAQSGSNPSKLSQSIPPPLTPHLEETKTPGGTLTQPAVASGFFSSVFSAAQKAADQLSNTINTSIAPNQKAKPAVSKAVQELGSEEVIPGTESQPVDRASEVDGKRQPAVETLGQGDLNLGHLGIQETLESTPMTSQTAVALQNGAALVEDGGKKAEEEAAARAVSQAYEKPVAAVVSQATGARPLSIASNDRLTLAGDQTPPRSGTDGEGLKRSGSVRSKLSGRRRHRASSATAGTSNSIAAGLTAAATGFQNVSASGTGHRLTGFAVASSKRNKDFHQLFRSVPEDDYLIEDYSAALQRDILLHGRLYVSEGHICFSSNILGWVTNLVISFDEVMSVEKKSTAVIFPNAIVIQTQHARNTFASFVARDSTYELLIGIWKISHPNLKSSLNGVMLDDAGTGDKTEVVDADGSAASDDTGSEDEVYDEDADDDAGSFEDAGLAPSIAGSDIAGEPVALSRKTSAQPLANGAPQTNGGAVKGPEGTDAVVTGAAVSVDFPGPPLHEATQCADGAEHYDRPLTDTTIPAPLGKVYSMTFGPASAAFMRKWLADDQKARDVNVPDSSTGLDNEHKTFVLDYIKPLNAPVGPRQTKCITTCNLVAYDLEKAVTVDCSTQTPDVPSGNVFTVKTRYCLMWGPGNSTRLVANCTVEWTGKSWLKGPIEKGANDGQLEYVNHLVASLKAAVTTKPAAKGPLPGRKGAKRKSKREALDADAAHVAPAAIAEHKASDWGPLEPLHALLRPLLAVVAPFVSSQVVIAVLVTLLLYSWIYPPLWSSRSAAGLAFPGYATPERLAAYEEIWRREESNLWDWLEDRVGLEGIYGASLGGGGGGGGDGGIGKDGKRRKNVAAAAAKQRVMAKRLEGERMSERQMDDAIRVTEERLGALKEAVEGRRVA